VSEEARRTADDGGEPEPPATSPYRGLIPYSEEDWPFFFGRSAEIRVISANLRASRLTLLYGPSGVGKSSLLGAGVVHHLRLIAEHDDAMRQRVGAGDDDPELDRAELAVVIFRAWRDPPLGPLTEAIRVEVGRAAAVELPAPPAGTPLTEALQEWTGHVQSLLLILDQFEDYFLYHPDRDADRGLADELERIVTTTDLRANVLLSLREDALAKLDRFKGRIPHLYENYLRLQHLSADAARDAILDPVAEHNRRLPQGAEPIEVEEGLVEAVLGAMELRAGRAVIDRREVAPRAQDPVEGDRVETSFLQLVMSRLWDAEMAAGSRVLRRSTLEELGGPRAIVQGHFETAMDALSGRERGIVAAVSQFLVTPSKTKVAQSAGDLAAWSEYPPDEVRAVLDRLCDGERVLRRVEPAAAADAGAPVRYEIFHDVLADAVLDWRARYQEHERAERERRKAVRRGVYAGAAVLLAVVMAFLAWYAFDARNEAEDQRETARSVAVAASATEAAGADPQLGLLLSQAALDDAPTPQAEEALRQTTNDVRQRALIPAGAGGAVARAAVYTPDGARLLTAGDDGRLAAWDPSGGSQGLLVPSGPRLNDVVLVPGADAVATADVNGVVTVRDLDDGTPRATLPAGSRGVNAVAADPAGRVVAAAGADGAIVLWDWRRDRVLRRLGAVGGPPVWRVAFSPDGRSLASADDDGRVRIWDARTGQERPFEAGPHVGPVYAVGYRGDGRRLASAGDDGTVRIYAMPSGRLLSILREHRGFVTDVEFSRGGRLLASTGLDGRIIVHDVRAERALATLVGHQGTVRRATFSPDGRSIASAGADGTARVWDWAGGALPIAAGRGPLRSVALSPDGSAAVTLGAESDPARRSRIRGVAKVWEWQGQGLAQRPVAAVEVPTADAVPKLAGATFLGPDEIAVGVGTDVLVRGIGDAGRAATLPSSRLALLESVAATPAGDRIAAASVDGHVQLWTWPDGRPDGEISAPAPKPDGSYPPAGAGRTDAAFFPDGERLVTGDSLGNLRVWSVERREPLAATTLDRRFIVDVAVSPDGRLVAASTDDGTVRLLDADTLADAGTLVGHVGPVAAVAFGVLDSRPLVVTGGTDGMVRVWDPGSGRALVTLRGQQGVVRDVAVTPDGRFVASAADDGSVVFWPCAVCGPIDEVRAEAGRRTIRELTADERERYLR
jgi:WD40 repeat protein